MNGSSFRHRRSSFQVLTQNQLVRLLAELLDLGPLASGLLLRPLELLGMDLLVVLDPGLHIPDAVADDLGNFDGPLPISQALNNRPGQAFADFFPPLWLFDDPISGRILPHP